MKTVKQTFAVIMALMVCMTSLFTFYVTAYAKPAEFDFSASPATVSKLGHVNAITLKAGYAYTACTGTDVAFRFRVTSSNYSWLGLSLDNTGPNGLGTGSGIRSVLFFSAGSAVTRVVDTDAGRGWEAAASGYEVQNGAILSPGKTFNDGEWHSVSVKSQDGVWSMLIDGVNAMSTKYSGVDDELSSMLGGTGSTYLVLYTDSSNGSMEIDQTMQEPTDKAALMDEIDIASAQHATAVVGTEPGTYTQTAYDSFSTAISAAQSVYNNASAAGTEVSAAITALKNAEYVFASSVIVMLDRSELTDLLESAQLILAKAQPGTQVGNAAQADIDALTAAYNSATTVKNDADATREGLDTAVADIRNAMTLFLSKVIPYTGEQIPFAFEGEALIAGKESAAINIIDDVVTVNLPDVGSTAHSVVTATNLEFSFKIDPSVDCQWFGLILSNSGWTSLGSGNGISALIWNNSNSVTARLVEQRDGKGWEGAANKQFANTATGDANTVFNDGMWHTFKLARASDGWKMTIDDVNCINAPYSDFDLDMDRLLGSLNTVTMSLFTNGDPAMISLSLGSGKKNTADLAGLTELVESADKLLSDTAAGDCSADGRAAFSAVLDETRAFMLRTDLSTILIEEQMKVLAKAIGAFKADIITTRNKNLPDEPNDPTPVVVCEGGVVITYIPIEGSNPSEESPKTSDSNWPLYALGLQAVSLGAAVCMKKIRFKNASYRTEQ